MAALVKLEATYREDKGKGAARQSRRDGRIPGVLYGKGESPVPISIDTKTVTRLVAQSGVHAILELEVQGAPGNKDKHMVMMKEVQRNALKNVLTHVDFQMIDMNAELERIIPIHMVGEAIGVKVGGILQHGVFELAVIGVANKIPEYLEGDVTNLRPGQVLRASELKFPAGIRPAGNGDEIVASVISPKGKGAEAAAALEELEATATPAEPELIGRKSDEEA